MATHSCLSLLPEGRLKLKRPAVIAPQTTLTTEKRRTKPEPKQTARPIRKGRLKSFSDGLLYP